MLPAPGIFEGLSEGEFGFPLELFFDFLWIRIAGGDIARSARADGIRDRDVGDAFEGLDEFLDARAFPGSDIVDGERFGGFLCSEEGFECRDMCLGEINHMNEITNARAVRSRIVISENGEGSSFSCGGLHEIGDKIVWGSEREFADESRWVRADRVEVAEGGRAEYSVGHDRRIAKDILADLFGVSVGRSRRFSWGGFRDREHIRCAVDGRGRGEDEGPDAMMERHVEDVDEGSDIVPVVAEWLLERFSDSLKCGEVDDSVDVLPLEDRGKEYRIRTVSGMERRTVSEYAFDAVEYR